MAGRRSFAFAAIALIALAALGGCASPQPGRVDDSMVGYNRTFDTALAAMTDQRLTISENDRRQGRIVGNAAGSTLVTTLQPMLDGTVRVNFQAKGQAPADEALLTRVAGSYNARMAKLSLLPGLTGSGGGDTGPTPCPTGAAMCP